MLHAYCIDAQKSLEHKSEVQNFWNFSVRVFLDVLFPVFSFSKASSFNVPDIFIHNLLNLGDVRNVATTIL